MMYTIQRNALSNPVSRPVECVQGHFLGDFAGIDTTDNLILKVPPM